MLERSASPLRYCGWMSLALLAGCAQPPETTATAIAPIAAKSDRPVVATQTLLLTVQLHPDGAAALTPLAVKPIPYRTPGVPFEPQLMTPNHDGFAKATTAPTTPEVPGPGGVDDTHTPTNAPEHRFVPPAASDFLVIRHGSLQAPFVVVLSLGHPGEGGGDVADRWQNGSVILRAPYFGTDTQYELVRAEQNKPMRLATTGGAL